MAVSRGKSVVKDYEPEAPLTLIVKRAEDSDTAVKDVLTRFLGAWQQQDWKAMIELSQITWLHYHSNIPEEVLQQYFDNNRLMKFEIQKAVQYSSNSFGVEVSIVYKKHNTRTTRRAVVIAMVIQESKPFTPDEESTWGVNPLSIYKAIGA